jgi:hypothetical protein
VLCLCFWVVSCVSCHACLVLLADQNHNVGGKDEDMEDNDDSAQDQSDSSEVLDTPAQANAAMIAASNGRRSLSTKETKIKVLQKPPSRQTRDGKFIRPKGRPPAGYEWNAQTGEYEAISGGGVGSMDRMKMEKAHAEGQSAKQTARKPGSSGTDVGKYKKPSVLPMRNLNGMYIRPAGRPPVGYSWNQIRGEWERVESKTPAVSASQKGNSGASHQTTSKVVATPNAAIQANDGTRGRHTIDGNEPFRACGNCTACRRRTSCEQCYNCLLAQWCAPYPLVSFYTCAERICRQPVILDNSLHRLCVSSPKGGASGSDGRRPSQVEHVVVATMVRDGGESGAKRMSKGTPSSAASFENALTGDSTMAEDSMDI